MREDVPPPPPKKDTPPPVDDKPARLSANIVDVRGASDAYSGNGFAATTEDVEHETPTNNSRETITVAFGDGCSPIKEVKSGVVKMTHASHSPFVGQKAVFEADPKVVKEIQEEFESPAMAPALFRSSQVGKMSPGSAEKAKTPRYIAGGLLEGGLLPATTYQPPPKISKNIDPKADVYSPSMYSVATGHDVFNVSFLFCSSVAPSFLLPLLLPLSCLYNFFSSALPSLPSFPLHLVLLLFKLSSLCTFLSFAPSSPLQLPLI